MTQIENIGMIESVMKISKREDSSFQQKVNRLSIMIISGCLLFLVSGLLNFTDEYFKGWSYTQPVLGYLLFGFTVSCLVPIAIGFRKLSETAFVEMPRKNAGQASWWLLCYALTVLLNLVLMGWPMVSSFVGFTIIIARILGFYYLYKAFMKIRVRSNLPIGGFLYLLYGGFYILTAILGGMASLVNDFILTNIIFIFDGVIESVLIIIISFKIIYDILIIRSFLVKGKRIGLKIIKRKKTFRERKTVTPVKARISIDERESSEEKYESYQITRKMLQRKTREVKIGKIGVTAIVIGILASLNVYFYLVSNYVMTFTTMAFTVSFLIYLFNMIIVDLLVKKGLILKTSLVNFFLLFVFVPSSLISSFYGIFHSLLIFLELEINFLVIVSVVFGLVLQIAIVNYIFKGRLNISNFKVKEYIASCMVLRYNNQDENLIKLQKKEIERKKSNIDKIDVISNRIAKRQEEKNISIDEFNWKEKVKKI